LFKGFVERTLYETMTIEEAELFFNGKQE
jgi:hypothetical protein